jgi:UDP-N-acetylmuramyl pentapeptide phosphotransferase/UDP-N-acetylglucosamine-1-phosphate transferase
MRSKALQALGEQEVSWFRLALIACVAGLLGGAVALGMVLLMLWLCQRSWVVDDAASHGISEVQSSRLGGVAVFLGAIAFFVVTEWTADSSKVSLSTVISSGDKLPSYMSYVFLIALVGLWDDFVTRFQPTSRLALVLAISMFAFLSDAVPMTVRAYDWLPLGLNNAFVLATAGTLVVTGFVNAGNMADGANGLLGIVGVSFFSVLLTNDSASFAAMFIMALLIFMTFNVVTGRIFLGDFGAYGLSAMLAFGSLKLYASGNVSLWFLASLLAYPCIEMVRVIVARAARGASPFQSANDHLHNYLYELLRKWGWNRILANSTTGCFLGAVSALLPASLVLSGVFDLGNTIIWGCYFAMYVMLHLSFAAQLERAIDET